jgi:hypothetical protein
MVVKMSYKDMKIKLVERVRQAQAVGTTGHSDDQRQIGRKVALFDCGCGDF